MIVFYKNYKRTERVLLCIQSVRHLFPDIDIRCLLLYDETSDEYEPYFDLFDKLDVTVYFDKKTYNFGPSGEHSPNNGYYFTEGINKIYKLVKKETQKVFILDEDEFFTTGATIRYLLDTEFDLACSHWVAPDPVFYEKKASMDMNGAFLCIVPHNVKKYFPLPERFEFIEILLGHELHDKCVADGLRVVDIPTRHGKNYHGDGVHDNNIETIKRTLTEHNIPFQL